METFDYPPRKDNCYTFPIQHMDIWKETVECYYHSDSTTNSNNWEKRKNGKTLITRYKNAPKDISLTITLHKTTGNVCIQGSSNSLDVWINHQSQPLMREYYKSTKKCATVSPENNKPTTDDVSEDGMSEDECADTDLGLKLPIIPIDNDHHETGESDSNEGEDLDRTVIELEKTVPYELVDYLSSSKHTPEGTSPTRPKSHTSSISLRVSSTPRKTPQSLHSTAITPKTLSEEVKSDTSILLNSLSPVIPPSSEDVSTPSHLNTQKDAGKVTQLNLSICTSEETVTKPKLKEKGVRKKRTRKNNEVNVSKTKVNVSKIKPKNKENKINEKKTVISEKEMGLIENNRRSIENMQNEK